MKAKDTVMSDEQIKDIILREYKWYQTLSQQEKSVEIAKEPEPRDGKQIAEAQAEISFPLGKKQERERVIDIIQEVLEISQANKDLLSIPVKLSAILEALKGENKGSDDDNRANRKIKKSK